MARISTPMSAWELAKVLTNGPDFPVWLDVQEYSEQAATVEVSRGTVVIIGSETPSGH